LPSAIPYNLTPQFSGESKEKDPELVKVFARLIIIIITTILVME
jgi:hypothetical protein